jgi:hypothetical protein
MRASRFFAVTLVAIAAQACAFIDNEVQLEYQSVAGLTPTPGNAQVIYLSLLNDSRTEKARVGVIRNGYGMETASVLSKDDARIWVSNTLKGNLEQAGYAVRTVETTFAPTANQFHLSGDLVSVYSDPRMGFFTITVQGDVQAAMQAEFQGRKTSKLIVGQYSEESLVSTGGDLHKRILNNALLDFVKKAMLWLDELKR